MRDEGRCPGGADAAPVQPLAGQAKVGVVRPQGQAELSARREHSIWFGYALCRQIIDQHANIRLGPVEHRRRAAANLAGRVHAGHETLGRRFLIAGGSVDLAGQEQAGKLPHLQPGRQRTRIHVVIFHRITRAAS